MSWGVIIMAAIGVGFVALGLGEHYLGAAARRERRRDGNL